MVQQLPILWVRLTHMILSKKSGSQSQSKEHQSGCFLSRRQPKFSNKNPILNVRISMYNLNDIKTRHTKS